MPCYHPRSLASGQVVQCGRCIHCKLRYSYDWAVRGQHESSLYTENCFVTLTYSPDHYPANGSLVKGDVQSFFRKLRKLTGKKVRYFLGEEYGERGHRPHYHICLFGLSVLDRSAIEEAWPWGFVHIGSLTFDRS